MTCAITGWRVDRTALPIIHHSRKRRCTASAFLRNCLLLVICYPLFSWRYLLGLAVRFDLEDFIRLWTFLHVTVSYFQVILAHLRGALLHGSPMLFRDPQLNLGYVLE